VRETSPIVRNFIGFFAPSTVAFPISTYFPGGLGSSGGGTENRSQESHHPLNRHHDLANPITCKGCTRPCSRHAVPFRLSDTRRSARLHWRCVTLNKTHPGKYPDPEDFVDNSNQGIAPAFGEGSVAKAVPTIFERSVASQI
jgi:hypothetical protein